MGPSIPWLVIHRTPCPQGNLVSPTNWWWWGVRCSLLCSDNLGRCHTLGCQIQAFPGPPCQFSCLISPIRMKCLSPTMSQTTFLKTSRKRIQVELLGLFSRWGFHPNQHFAQDLWSCLWVADEFHVKKPCGISATPMSMPCPDHQPRILIRVSAVIADCFLLGHLLREHPVSSHRAGIAFSLAWLLVALQSQFSYR